MQVIVILLTSTIHHNDIYYLRKATNTVAVLFSWQLYLLLYPCNKCCYDELLKVSKSFFSLFINKAVICIELFPRLTYHPSHYQVHSSIMAWLRLIGEQCIRRICGYVRLSSQ